MAQAYDRIVAAMKTVADAGSDRLHKLVFGSHESIDDYVMYPDPDDDELEDFSKSRQKGTLWRSVIVPAILSQLGIELDRSWAVWANIYTGASGAPPSITGGYGVQSVAKDELSDYLTITLSPAYASDDWAPGGFVLNESYFVALTGIVAASATVEVQNSAGGTMDINKHFIRFFGIGGM